MATITGQLIHCSHCGERCDTDRFRSGDNMFCCEGCRMVFQLLDKSGLCDYYTLNEHPGVRLRERWSDKFAFLDDAAIAAKLISFRDEEQTHVSFYLPQMHCSSCLYLLEHLYRMDRGIVRCRVDFTARTVMIIFKQDAISLRGVADLLASVGYEPYISLHDLKQVQPKAPHANIYRLGIAGFCFANIMLISFPEYLGLGVADRALRDFFRWLDLLLSLPVLLYSAYPFYATAWKGLRSRVLNIDAPIVLAIGVTFSRSVYEVLSGTGSGYFDSMTGIVFFMLAGRVLQDRTYRRLSFERDYTSYFPVAVTVVDEDGKGTTKALPEIRSGDRLRIHAGELIPADGMLTRGEGQIDYSFVTGESVPVSRRIGDLVYAGGRQCGGGIEILVVKEVVQSYLTALWDRQDDRDGGEKVSTEKGFGFIHFFARWFTYIVFGVATLAALYWWRVDPGKIWNAVTAVLIVACPCALLLSSTFTNGNILRILGRHQCYLRNASVIERMATTSHIVFDKTGTLTEAGRHAIAYVGVALSEEMQDAVAVLARQSGHPLSRALAGLRADPRRVGIRDFKEVTGEGVEGIVKGYRLALGRKKFVGTAGSEGDLGDGSGTRVWLGLNDRVLGYYSFSNCYRPGVEGMVSGLRPAFRVSVLSGDDDREAPRLSAMMGKGTRLLFNQGPGDKSAYVATLRQRGEKVMMIGDGLNDAGALQQSEVGIAVTDNFNNFTPASDVILEAGRLPALPAIIRFCRAGKTIVLISFVVSILYNIIGLSFAVRGSLSPVLAAILMPASSLSILLITYGCSGVAARKLGFTK